MIRQLNHANGPIEGELPGYYHGDGIWFDQGYHVTYRRLAKCIVDWLAPKSVLELGSGAGSLAWHIRDLMPGSLVVTIDGNPDTRKSPWIAPDKHFVCRTDQDFVLIDDYNTARSGGLLLPTRLLSFDLIVSFEHFEHIQHHHFGTLIENIRRHSNPSSHLLATAANCTYADLPTVHCNVKSAEEWDTYLRSFGMHPSATASFIKGNTPFNFQAEKTTELFYRVNP